MNYNSSSLSEPYDSDKQDQKLKRNVWTERKNEVLVDIVKASRYPTPWRPRHGTSKEVWTEIANKIAERPDVFDFAINWESAKEQLTRIIERQKLRRCLGDFVVKTEQEAYVDDMIKHIAADDEDRAKRLQSQFERSLKRKNKTLGAIGDTESENADTIEELAAVHDAKKARLPTPAEEPVISDKHDKLLQRIHQLQLPAEQGYNITINQHHKQQLEILRHMEQFYVDQDKERQEQFLLHTHEHHKFYLEKLGELQRKLDQQSELLNGLYALVAKIATKVDQTN